MHTIKYNFSILISSLLLLVCPILLTNNTPRLTLVVVIDQFAHHYLSKLKQHCNGGIKFLLHKGVVYENAYHPNAMPSTAPGHAAFNTGTTAHNHGIIGNSWFDIHGNEIQCDDDTTERAAVFSPTGTYAYGKSSHNIMVDGLSDQLRMQSQPLAKNQVFSLSLKSRSAIMTASKLGKAIWFDDKTGFFTSSKAYFDALPTWLTTFNKKQTLTTLDGVQWELFYPTTSPAYAFSYATNYTLSSKKPLVNTTIPIDRTLKKPYKPFQRTPHANKLLFDLAQDCIDTHLNDNPNDKLFIWLSLSSLDKLGHKYGPDSIEVIDMLYHLDNQLEQFIRYTEKAVGKKNFLIVLTSDHGIAPLYQRLQLQGFKASRQVLYKDLIISMNELINTTHGIATIVHNFEDNQFYLNMNLFKTLTTQKQQAILTDLKQYLLRQPGIKSVWTYEELHKAATESREHKSFFKNQLFPGRSGQLICQTYPYVLFTSKPSNTAHKTPYDYDTHIPLMLYQNDRFERKTIVDTVWSPQLAPTLAYILDVPKPSACTYDMLPGLVTTK